MKRILCCILLIALLYGCGGQTNHALPSKLNRDAVLPLSMVENLCGGTMQLAFDRRDDREGQAVWAWEESGGDARLLYLEISMPPANCDEMYQKASEGAKTLSAPEGMQACCNKRSISLRFGIYYVKIVTLGIDQTNDALELLQVRLKKKLDASK